MKDYLMLLGKGVVQAVELVDTPGGHIVLFALGALYFTHHGNMEMATGCFTGLGVTLRNNSKSFSDRETESK